MNRQSGSFGLRWSGEQVAGALVEDMSVVSNRRAGADETAGIRHDDFERLFDYLRLLGPPAQRMDHPPFARGAIIFGRIRCGTCDRVSMTTGTGPQRAGSAQPTNAVMPPTIWPLTDLLLGDVGKDLADSAGSTPFDRGSRAAFPGS